MPDSRPVWSQGFCVDPEGFDLAVQDSFLAMGAAEAKPDHVPVFPDFRFRELPPEDKYIDAEEKEWNGHKNENDDEQLGHGSQFI